MAKAKIVKKVAKKVAKKGAKKVAKKVAKKATKKPAAKKAVTKVKRDPRQPKRGMSAFFLWLGANRTAIAKSVNAGPKDLAKIGKAAGKAWGAMGDAAKKKWQDSAAKDKARFEREKKAFLARGGVFVGKKKRAKKDKNAPKRAMSAFMFFANANRENIRKRIGAEKKDIAKIGKALGAAWNGLNDQAKAPYAKLAAKDSARYTAARAKYVAKMK